jgi:exonuclease III
MKIITWNCAMSFRTKADLILAENPDILIIPECENPQKLNFGLYTKRPSDMIWYGDNPNKGIGVFSYGNYRLELLDVHNPEFRYILPIAVSNETQQFILFAVWAQKPFKNDQYVTQVWNAMNYYSKILDEENVIIAGDFNSSSFFDRPNKVSHTELVKFLRQKKVISTYHFFHNQHHGTEMHMTHFWQKKLNQSFHLDYCFASASFFHTLKNVEIGTYEKWIKYSDHKPVIVEFENIDHCNYS